ncbi:MAG: hypothetical protein JWN51_1027 [Phycisphaerales bacterium]|nr:hypothetical protein [Phycisphaerales bacterium]
MLLSAAASHAMVSQHHASASIAGVVFEDLNGDGVRQAGEMGIAGATVYIDKNHNAKPDGKDPRTVTDATGHYVISGLRSSASTVREALPAGWKLERLVKHGKHSRGRTAHGSVQDFANQWTGGAIAAIPRQAQDAPTVGVVSHYNVTSLTAGIGIPQGSNALSINRFGQILFSVLGSGGNPTYIYSNGAVTPLGSWQTAAQNDVGDVALTKQAPGTGAPEVWLYSKGKLEHLATLPGNLGYIYGFNTSGEVLVGGATAAWLVSSAGVVTPVAPPAGFTQIIQVSGLNDAGQVIGLAANGPVPGTAFLYRNGHSILLNPAGGHSYTKGINNKGQVLVESAPPGSDLTRLYIYAGGAYTDITPAGAANGAGGTKIDEAGDVVGVYSDANNVAHRFFYRNGSYSDMGNILPAAINASGEVVGMAYTSNGYMPHGYVFADGVYHDLNDLIGPNSGWLIAQANSINDSGEIIGLACPIQNGQPNYAEANTVLLTPAT